MRADDEREEERGLEEALTRAVERHLGDCEIPIRDRRNYIDSLQWAPADKRLFGMEGCRGDTTAFATIAKAIRTIRKTALSLSDDGRDYLNDSASRVEPAREIGFHRLRRGDGFEELDRVLETAVDMAERRMAGALAIHNGPTKADTEAAALAHECRKVWEHATGNPAPRTIRASGDIPGGDASRTANKFELFCRDVFAAHDRPANSVPNAFDAMRRQIAKLDTD